MMTLMTLLLSCTRFHCLSQQQGVTSRPALQVQWKNSTPDQNSWYGRDKLEEMGFTKLVNDIDAKEAARLGLVTRPLTEAVVQKHLEDLGLEAAFGTHSQMRGLSGTPPSAAVLDLLLAACMLVVLAVACLQCGGACSCALIGTAECTPHLSGKVCQQQGYALL